MVDSLVSLQKKTTALKLIKYESRCINSCVKLAVVIYYSGGAFQCSNVVCMNVIRSHDRLVNLLVYPVMNRWGKLKLVPPHPPPTHSHTHVHLHIHTCTYTAYARAQTHTSMHIHTYIHTHKSVLYIKLQGQAGSVQCCPCTNISEEMVERVCVNMNSDAAVMWYMMGNFMMVLDVMVMVVLKINAGRW